MKGEPCMKSVFGGGNQISPRQIRLRELFSVERILAARGFQVESEGSARDTLLEKDFWSYEDLNLLFEVFENHSYREDLLHTVEQAGYQPRTAEVVKLASRAEFRKERQRYSSTFEWFVGELLIRRFMAFSSSFGVTVKGLIRNSDGGTSGDYDVLSVLGDMNLLYLECKTGKCRQHSILNSLERSIGLHSVACVMFLGAGLSVSQLRQQLSGVSHPRFGHSGRLARISTRGVPDSDIFQWLDVYFIGAGEVSGEVENKLRTALRILAANRSSVFENIKPDPNEYSVMGYDYTDVLL
jgi:hypothetical protein